MPPETDERAIYLQLLNSVNAPTRYGHTVPHLRQIVRDLLSYTGTRMLVIDEVHSLLASCGWRIDTEAVKRLDSRNALR